MGSGMSRETRFGARTPLVAIPTVATAPQGYFPAATARADTARPGDAAGPHSQADVGDAGARAVGLEHRARPRREDVNGEVADVVAG